MNTAAEASGLFAIDELLVAGQPGLYVSLGSDAVAQAIRHEAAGVQPAASKRSGVIDTLWIMIPLAALACVLAWYFTRASVAAEAKQEFEEYNKRVEQFLHQQIEKTNAQQTPLYRGQLARADQAIANGNALAARQILLSAPAVSAEKSLTGMRGFAWDYLWNRVHPERYNLTGHLGTVHAVAVSGDGKLAASAADDGTVRLWNLGKGEAAGLIKVGSAPLHAVALAPDGKTVAAGGADKKVHVFDIGTLGADFVTITKAKQTLGGHTGDVLALAFAKDGSTLASGSADQTVVLWDVKAGTPCATLKEHVAAVQALAFSPDGKTLASGAAAPW